MKNCWNKIILGAMLLSPFDAFADINIAVMTPMGGDYKYFSEELIDGAKIAVDEINNRGGLEGKKINLIPIDDPCDDALSLSAAQMMALNKSDENKIHMLLGPYCGNSADQIANLLAKARIIQIHPTGVSKARYKMPQPGVIRFTGFKEEQIKELLRFIKSHYPKQNLAVVYDGSNPDMASMIGAFREEYSRPDSEGSLILSDYGLPGVTLEKAAAKVTDGGASLVYIMGNSDQIIELADRLKNVDDELVLFADRYQLYKKFARKIGRLSENSYLLSMPPLTSNPNFASSLVRLRLWGIEPEGLMPYGYLSVKMWAGMVKGAKSFNYNKLLRQLEGKTVETGWDNVIYTGGVPDKSLPYIIYRIKDGEYAQVY